MGTADYPPWPERAKMGFELGRRINQGGYYLPVDGVERTTVRAAKAGARRRILDTR